MGDAEKKSKNLWTDLKDLLENANKLAGFVAMVVAAITFASGNRLVSYLFILIACVSIDFFLWRLFTKPIVPKSNLLIVSHGQSKTVSVDAKPPIQRQAKALLLIALLSIASLTWIGYNVWQDYGNWQTDTLKAHGYVAPTAIPNELLVLLADFEPRGTKKYSVEERIQTQLTIAIKDANIPNARIARMPTVKTESDARRIGTLHQAVFVIWGWYDDAGFNSKFTIIRENKQPLQQAELKEIPAELRDFNLYIREGLPSQMSYFATFTIGQLYYWDKQYDESILAFEVALANIEQSSKVNGIVPVNGISTLYFYRGRIQQTQKMNLDQAITDYTKAIEFDPNLVGPYNNRGNAYTNKGNFDQAIADFTKAIELDPKNALFWYNRGTTYKDKGNLDKAIADYTKAIELAPKYAGFYNNRGNAYTDKGNFDQAIADFTKAIELDPKNALFWYNRGTAYSNQGNLDQAIADSTKAIELDPMYAGAYNNRGNAHSAKGNLDQAIADYTKAIELDPKGATAYSNRGNVYLHDGNLDQAIADYTKAIELNPKYAPAYYNRGNAYTDKGNFDQAIADYTKAIELAPKYANAYYNR
ncbi:MAG: tetratricopeptide repeat protein, partial [Chloroflexi bacterium]|nr:tetratricopeptide repeat protein [Chloroflexota bacterium]